MNFVSGLREKIAGKVQDKIAENIVEKATQKIQNVRGRSASIIQDPNDASNQTDFKPIVEAAQNAFSTTLTSDRSTKFTNEAFVLQMNLQKEEKKKQLLHLLNIATGTQVIAFVILFACMAGLPSRYFGDDSSFPLAVVAGVAGALAIDAKTILGNMSSILDNPHEFRSRLEWDIEAVTLELTKGTLVTPDCLVASIAKKVFQ